MELSVVARVLTEVLLPISVVVCAGYALGRTVTLEMQSINRLSLYLLSPVLVFVLLVRVRVEAAEAVRIVAFMALFVIVIGAVAWLSGRVLGLEASAAAALLLCVMFMNAGNYGLPTARFAFGQEGFERAALFFAVQAILAQTFAVYIAAGTGRGPREGLARLVRMPQVYAVLAALAIRGFGVQGALLGGEGLSADLFRGLDLLADATVPVLLVVLGMQLAESGRIEEGRRVALATGLRLVASVPVAFGLAYLLGLDELSTKLAVVLSSMPTAVNMIILAVEFDVRPGFVGSVVTVSTATSIVTLALLLALLGGR